MDTGKNTPQTLSMALIIGVTGMVGLSLAESLKKPTTHGGPWLVCGTARRARPNWLAPSLLDHYIQLDVLDFKATNETLSPFSTQVTHVFWITHKPCENEEANIIQNSAMLDNVLKVLTSSPESSLRHVTLLTGTKQYMGPIEDRVLIKQVTPHEAPFREDFSRIPCPNFYYALEDLLISYEPKLTWSVHRSSIILGASPRSIRNMLLSLAVYALICRREGLPFRFPGGKFMWDYFCDASDADLLAEQQIWAAVVSEEAKNQAFNCTNGDVYTWKGFWKVLCEIFGVEFVGFDEGEKFDWVGEMNGKGKVWDAIVEENGLCKTKLEEITCFEACKIVFDFQFQHVCSMNKSREFGFYGYADTCKSVKKWVERLREMNIIPKT